MTAHTHIELTEGCHRCELHKDEVATMRNEMITNIVNMVWDTSTEKLYIIEQVLDLP